jgi:hypothetical protein
MGESGGNVYVRAPAKSVGAAIILTFFFGPLGMLYSTVLGAFIMFLLYVVVGIGTFGVGLVVLHPIAIVWAAIAASGYNQRSYGRAVSGTQPGRGAPASPAATYRECPHCKENMRRDAGTCPRCRKESPAWTFHGGHWWVTGDSGAQFWLDERANEWKRFEAST